MNLWEQYQANKAQKQGMYFPREAAADLGVSEGALMADAPETVYLGGKNHVRGIVLKLHTLGLVQCIVRNSVCVHEKQGIYENVSMSETSGIAVNVGGIDLRIFPARWHHVLAVTNRDGEKVSRSVQFYDEFGVSVQKVFMREEGKEAEWQALLDAFRTEGKPAFQTGELPPATATPALLSEKEAAFQERWNELKDVHHFGGLLETFEVDRQTAYRHAPEGSTKLLNHSAWQQVLEAARDRGINIMIFAGNRGLVQIQTGKVHNVVRARGYLNVLDGKEEGFSMHLKDDEIVETWVVRRPIRDGFVTCVEGFDSRRKTVLQIFGKRKEGEPELEAWREITDKLLAS
ncbi:ChuX/HutX family heme-like substrate-binding protein [Neisseria zoodegmatis]|uniref:Hemin transport protein hemS n=1 Tax=Neisseria zoodegmatis TaxID=326523 RepID=A0AB38DT39_9NEIS|nr:ChuX/HutX family heme-like substrate-binding protein [Neisseria zoodegmatis]OSI10907.1 hemin-degrading factor [Neisseria zoodegmatis]SNU80142.1 Hemin transport protein hemS [Neisseria zoodegmatis]